jgi:hypothetical protein
VISFFITDLERAHWAVPTASLYKTDYVSFLKGYFMFTEAAALRTCGSGMFYDVPGRVIVIYGKCEVIH